ncbi:MAG TPA: SAM-dependent methyltransferase [Candidatus Acidoferrum sp.]|jgi:methyltransferase (TIGR00027 family)|nr:SAM-dependent methyltransferase [Candidatus Acidoferrum sp.]
MTDTLIENVSDTAFGVAHYRAIESERADALFRDPLASLLAGDRGKQIANAMPMSFMAGQLVVIRTFIFDDYIRLAITQDMDTILNLGAGLDTRPYRMDLPESLVWIEADYPHVIEFKEERLSSEKPRCQLERLTLDLANLSERRKVLASINARATKLLVLTEGVVSYLSVEEVGSLADDLKTLDHACYWIVEYFSPELTKFRRRRSVRRRMQNAPFKFTPNDWFGFFAEHGWRPKEIRYLAEEAERLHRPIQLPVFLKVTVKIRTLFASNEQRAAFKRFQGYVMLEPGATTLAYTTPSQNR